MKIVILYWTVLLRTYIHSTEYTHMWYSFLFFSTTKYTILFTHNVIIMQINWDRLFNKLWMNGNNNNIAVYRKWCTYNRSVFSSCVISLLTWELDKLQYDNLFVRKSIQCCVERGRASKCLWLYWLKRLHYVIGETILYYICCEFLL